MLQVLRGTQALHATVPIAAALVRGSSDLGQMGCLVQGGGSLVLSMTGA